MSVLDMMSMTYMFCSMISHTTFVVRGSIDVTWEAIVGVLDVLAHGIGFAIHFVFCFEMGPQAHMCGDDKKIRKLRNHRKRINFSDGMMFTLLNGTPERDREMELRLGVGLKRKILSVFFFLFCVLFCFGFLGRARVFVLLNCNVGDTNKDEDGSKEISHVSCSCYLIL
ncbi:unnamed protein product [Thlaspi arvense]|uniref:Transmembrane protein n=1 Tax=Thlaspi arvense TaxID=13288 RepID=A0AAU9RT85_THLAR|nr:unnamed protein product [Thlaspi arvense]